jgi:hypothetical protein
MYSLKIFGFIIVALTLIAVASPGASAETLKEKVATLEVLPLEYGSNAIKVNGHNILIIKGAFKSEIARGGDGYFILVQDGGVWQLARYEDGKKDNDVVIWALPHTGEDSISSIHFMVSRGSASSKNLAELYLLKTTRHYKITPTESALAEFTLSALHRDDDFGIYYLHTLKRMTSTIKYCNADSAAYHELGIPLLEGGNDFSCALH